MNVTFLGTGTSQGIPIIGSNHPVCLSDDPKDKRLRSSIMIEWDEYRYVIDCGPDFRQQMLREQVDSIDGIVFTHEHADHTAGLDDIRAFSHKMGDVPLYVPERIIGNLEQRFYYIFTKVNRYPGAPSAGIQVVDNKEFILANKKIVPIEFLHGKLPIFGYRIDNFAYLTDLKSISDAEKNKLKKLDVLVVNALRTEPHPTHLNLEDALNFIEELQPKKAYLTHISHKLGFHSEVEKQLPENVFLAYDGLRLNV
ncbi:MBL fold metallo-hydrolase [Aureibaculum conchae]|uniref:MBL fold metallo-hydrolase n=1 Tax=Aureibaculum sp. 2308TA14-22 TaxID=3108392 RepID=UPI0033969735